jgi:hypothetical protein
MLIRPSVFGGAANALGLLLSLLSLRPAHAALEQVDYLRELVERSRKLNLSAEKQWLRLGHYRKSVSGRWKSEADGRAFFFSPKGWTDPSAELEATLAGFFKEELAENDQQHPQCQFPARFSWLHSRLEFDFERLHAQRCARFEEFRDRLSAKSVTFVFSSYYLNNPASAFGHTFLRINKTDFAYEGERFELLDYGIDYAATVDTTNALIYGFKGLTGLFPGRFNYYPYFYKVREYNDYESRDLWEYDVKLTQPQVDLLVAHLWELGSTYFSYYYVTKNCSYHILTTLEVANPDLKLIDPLDWFVVPANTVRAVFANKDFVRGTHYRPSINTQFQARLAGLSNSQQTLLDRIVEDPGAPIPPQINARQAAETLDAALDYVDLRYARELVHGTDAAALQLKQHLLERRSEILIPSEKLQIEVPLDRQPHVGHGTKRVGAGGGYSTRLGPYGEIDFRLGIHDLADSYPAYPELSQIEFFPARLRYNTDQKSVWIEDFSIVRVISLSSVDRFQVKPSWQVRLGITTVRDGGCDSCAAGVFEIDGGLSKSFFGPTVTGFAMAGVELLGSPPLRGRFDLPLRLGVGPLGGLRFRVGEHFNSVLSGTFKYLFEGEVRSTYSASWVSRVHLSKEISLSLELKKLPQAWEGVFAPLFYF